MNCGWVFPASNGYVTFFKITLSMGQHIMCLSQRLGFLKTPGKMRWGDLFKLSFWDWQAHCWFLIYLVPAFVSGDDFGLSPLKREGNKDYLTEEHSFSYHSETHWETDRLITASHIIWGTLRQTGRLITAAHHSESMAEERGNGMRKKETQETKNKEGSFSCPSGEFEIYVHKL